MNLFFCWQCKSNWCDKVVIDYDSIKIDFPSCCVKDTEMDSFPSFLSAFVRRQTNLRKKDFYKGSVSGFYLSEKSEMKISMSNLTTFDMSNNFGASGNLLKTKTKTPWPSKACPPNC